jgi:NarL family two-component system response regulator LiaR
MIRLAIVNDYELVVAGVAAMLADDRHRIRVTALDASADSLDGVDVVLYDTFGPVNSSMDCLEELVRRSRVPVIVFTWKLRPAVAREALDRGASGYLSKALTGPQIADAIQAVLQGEIVVSPDVATAEAQVGGDWPGRDIAGLTAREAEMLTMIAAGMSNQEIADRSYLSINSVKTYVRIAYRKIGAQRRSQAVRWALENGFTPTPDTNAATEPALHRPYPAGFVHVDAGTGYGGLNPPGPRPLGHGL